MKNSQVAGFGILLGDKIPLEEKYEKKLGDTRIPKLRQENQPMRRRGFADGSFTIRNCRSVFITSSDRTCFYVRTCFDALVKLGRKDFHKELVA